MEQETEKNIQGEIKEEEPKKIYEVQITRPFRFGKISVKSNNQLFEQFTKFPVDGYKFLMCGKARGHLTIPEVQEGLKKAYKGLKKAAKHHPKFMVVFFHYYYPQMWKILTNI